MSERKINLEEILRKHTSVEWEGISPKELILKAMLDFGKQLLELAAENAYITTKDEIDGILDTVKQIK